MANFQEEFPDFPAADMPAIPAGFEDVSWHNDACPCIARADMCIFIDYVNVDLREHGGDYPRFNVQPMRDGIEITGDCGLQTDDWAEVLAYIAKRDAEA